MDPTTTPTPESGAPPGLLTYEDLATRWHTSPRNARRFADRLRIRGLRLGHRTVRFRLIDIERAEIRNITGA